MNDEKTYDLIVDAILALAKVRHAVQDYLEKDLIGDMEDCLREMKKEHELAIP